MVGQLVGGAVWFSEWFSEWFDCLVWFVWFLLSAPGLCTRTVAGPLGPRDSTAAMEAPPNSTSADGWAARCMGFVVRLLVRVFQPHKTQSHMSAQSVLPVLHLC